MKVMEEDKNIVSASDVIQQRWQSVIVSNICIDYLIVKANLHTVENRAEMIITQKSTDQKLTHNN